MAGRAFRQRAALCPVLAMEQPELVTPEWGRQIPCCFPRCDARLAVSSSSRTFPLPVTWFSDGAIAGFIPRRSLCRSSKAQRFQSRFCERSLGECSDHRFFSPHPVLMPSMALPRAAMIVLSCRTRTSLSTPSQVWTLRIVHLRKDLDAMAEPGTQPRFQR